MTQTLAILVDAYRELNSRRLFWITLALSGLVVTVFALLGIDEKGIVLAGWHIESFLNTSVVSREEFYKSAFVNFGIGVWLSWIAAILALVSTAGMVPDLISSGSVELVLSKPIGRVRLFLTKYLAALLFVTLQVTLFSLASFLVLGLRAGAWELGVFLAIPIMVVFFSYLFSICTLFGLLTRSTVAALLLTLLTWFTIFLLHAGESNLMMFKMMAQQRSDYARQSLERTEEQIEELENVTPDESAAPDDSGDSREKTDKQTVELRSRLESEQETLDSAESSLGKLTIAHDIVYGIKTVLPKTSETIALLERWLIEFAELPNTQEDDESEKDFQKVFGNGVNQQQVAHDLERTMRSRSVGWVMGTSLAFEGLVLALASWIFWRRDF